MIGVDRHGSAQGDEFHEAVAVLVQVQKRSGSDVASHEGGHASGSAHAFASELHVAGESEGFIWLVGIDECLCEESFSGQGALGVNAVGSSRVLNTLPEAVDAIRVAPSGGDGGEVGSGLLGFGVVFAE
jgi:hypothetical protein